MKLEDLTEYFQLNLYEMSNYYSDTTGLSSGTALWVRTEPNEIEHVKYRIKLIHPQHGSAVFPIWGDELEQLEGNWKITGRDLKKVITLLSLTKDSLKRHIDGEIDSVGLGRVFDAAKPHIESL